MTGINLLEWAGAQHFGGAFSLTPAVTGVPAASWYRGNLEVTEPGIAKVIITDVFSGISYTNVIMGATESQGWVSLPTSADLAGKMQHGSVSLSNYTTVLEMALSVPVDTSVFSLSGTALCVAADSPIPGAEMQYLVLMDYGDRRTVLAINYANDTTEHQMFVRKIWSGAWKQSKWAEFSTSTPPEEHDLPLAEGITGTVKYRKNQFSEETVYGACELTSDITHGSIFAILPAGYRAKYAMSFQAFSGSGAQTSTGTIDIDINGNLYYRMPHVRSGDIFRFLINFIAA